MAPQAGPRIGTAPTGERVMVDFIGIERVQELVGRLGPARFIEELAEEIESD